MNLIVIRLLNPDELEKIYQIDRSEEIEHRYRYIDGELKAFDESASVPHDPNYWDTYYDKWKAALGLGSEAFGAFDEEQLSGIVILNPNLEPRTEQLPALYVDSNHRMSGIAKSLYLKAENTARSRKSKTLYVCATPTDSSVNYLPQPRFRTRFDPKCRPPREESRGYPHG
jgi:GNAT superfamily N-acetyltransferase